MVNKIHTLLGSDISIVGDISYEGIVHIEASVEGSLVANKSKESKLYINKASIVKGYVDATNIAINGTVYGNVYAYELLQLGSDAIITLYLEFIACLKQINFKFFFLYSLLKLPLLTVEV